MLEPDAPPDDSGGEPDGVGTVANKHKTHIAVDQVKNRHTPHWDDDLMSWEQLRRAYDEGRVERRRYKRRQYLWAAMWLALLCLHPMLIYWLGRWLGDG